MRKSGLALDSKQPMQLLNIARRLEISDLEAREIHHANKSV